MQIALLGIGENQLGRAMQDILEGLRAWRLWYLFGFNDVKMRYRRSTLGPFWATFFNNTSTTDLWGSVLKTTLFGAIIAIVCCYKGMTASGGAEGVGRAVNEAVVIAFLGIFAFNYAFTQTLLATHPEITSIVR